MHTSAAVIRRACAAGHADVPSGNCNPPARLVPTDRLLEARAAASGPRQRRRRRAARGARATGLRPADVAPSDRRQRAVPLLSGGRQPDPSAGRRRSGTDAVAAGPCGLRAHTQPADQRARVLPVRRGEHRDPPAERARGDSHWPLEAVRAHRRVDG